jgi:hypothetical protein
VADHVGAQHVRGRRFDYRYRFWMRHNHCLLLGRNYGIGSRVFRAWMLGELCRLLVMTRWTSVRQVANCGIGIGGLIAGVVTVLRKARWSATDPRRVDESGNAVRRGLASEPGRVPSSS